MMDQDSDAALVRRVLAGDTVPFARLVERYTEKYARFAWRMLGSTEDAEEAMQDAFVRAFKSLDKCEDAERFGPWFHSILLNQCRTLATRRGRREKRFTQDIKLETFAAAEDLTSDDWRAEIDLALAQLPAEQREAFLLKHVEEMSYEQMAEISGENISTLKMRVKRACEKMRRHLEGVMQ